MRCEDAQPLIGAWQDGELRGLTAWRIGRHVIRCAACSADSDELRRLEERLRATAPFSPEPNARISIAAGEWRLRRAARTAVVLGTAGFVLSGVYWVRRSEMVLPTVGPVAVVPTPAAPPRQEAPVRREASEPHSESVVRQTPKEPRHLTVATTAPERRRRPRRLAPRRAKRPMLAVNSRPFPRHLPVGHSVMPTGRAPVRPEEQQIIVIAARTLTPDEIAAKNEVLLIQAMPVSPDYRPAHIE